MFRTLIASFSTSLLLAFCALSAVGQEAIQKGRIKKIDAAAGTLTLATPDGKDRELTAMASTRYMAGDGSPLKDGLKSPALKPGELVMFKAIAKDGKDWLVGLRIAGSAQAQEPPKVDLAKLRPLTEMGNTDYQGYKGGLYPNGKNERPADHEKAGLALARAIQPLDQQGNPSPDGKIVLLSVGMSNTTQVFSTFKKLADAEADKNPRLIIVDGAQGGMTAARIQDPDDGGGGANFWSVVDKRLQAAGVTREQVQAVWIKQADAGPTQGFPKYAQTLQAELTRIVQIFPKRFPNAKLVYLSSRTYGGYARTKLNPEPYAFESGFSVKWLIEQQIKGAPALNYDAARGPVMAPWLSWGPYLWAKGAERRSDGFYYEESDFAKDGTHPSAAGQRKVAEQLLRFFKTDTTTRAWFCNTR